MLVVKNRGWVDTSVQGYSRDVFVGDGVGIMKFLRDARGKVTGFTVNRVAHMACASTVRGAVSSISSEVLGVRSRCRS